MDEVACLWYHHKIQIPSLTQGHGCIGGGCGEFSGNFVRCVKCRNGIGIHLFCEWSFPADDVDIQLSTVWNQKYISVFFNLCSERIHTMHVYFFGFMRLFWQKHSWYFLPFFAFTCTRYELNRKQYFHNSIRYILILSQWSQPFSWKAWHSWNSC